ncbi:MAG TPA: leucyl/phenylalanyl-tRNA--protein transferase [Burkholderiaceae bacterium]|nr:leucyl/phenylalanyl-tRNA--protein transferase [Burkholderiaceae bacterium]
MIAWLEPGAPFPAVSEALDHPNGLLAASESLSPEQLIAAYRRGIFPWYSEGDPVLWWCPDPRMVLPTAQFHVSRSLRKALRTVASDPRQELRLDYDFEGVMRCCAAPRAGQDGTWITDEVIAAYCELAKRNLAHSMELWVENELVGAVYGVSLGRMFFGESMFSRVRDGSKIALAALVAVLSREQVPVIDCQQRTAHLASLGACELPRRVFCAQVAQSVAQAPVNWSTYRGVRLNRFMEKC